jgi:hypothetical protein
MTQAPSVDSGRTLLRWSMPMAKIPHSGAPEAIYATLAAGRASDQFAIEARIFRYCSHLRRSRLCTLMFAISSSRHGKSLLVCFKLFSMAAAGQGRRHDHETTVDHALIRGLVTAGPVIRRGASSV